MALYGTTMPFPTRMTIVHLSNGGLWRRSPVRMTADLKSAIDTLGPLHHGNV